MDVGAWVGVASFAATVGGWLFTLGKATDRLNGFGGRLTTTQHDVTDIASRVNQREQRAAAVDAELDGVMRDMGRIEATASTTAADAAKLRAEAQAQAVAIGALEARMARVEAQRDADNRLSRNG